MAMLFFVTCLTISCTKDDDGFLIRNDTYRKIAWDYLTDSEKETVIHDWKDAKVEDGQYWETNEDAKAVIFNTTDDPLLGPIIIYINPKTKEVLGIGARF